MLFHRNGHSGDVLGFQQKGVAARRDVGAYHGQPVQGHALQVVGHESRKLRLERGMPRVHVPLVFHARAQRGRSALELLVDDQALDEYVACLLGREVVELVVYLGLGRLGGDERGRLHLQQGGRHDEKVAGHVEV